MRLHFNSKPISSNNQTKSNMDTYEDIYSDDFFESDHEEEFSTIEVRKTVSLKIWNFAFKYHTYGSISCFFSFLFRKKLKKLWMICQHPKTMVTHLIPKKEERYVLIITRIMIRFLETRIHLMFLRLPKVKKSFKPFLNL